MYDFNSSSRGIKEFYSEIPQEEIFRLVFKEYPDLSKSYKSPLRKDKNPGCYFEWYGNVLYFVDWTRKQVNSDALQVIKDFYRLNNVGEAITLVQELLMGYTSPIPISNKIGDVKPKKERTKIIPIRREWMEKDVIYWKQFNITIEQLTEDLVFPVSSANIRKDGMWKRSNFFDLSYCFTLDKEIYKIYRPQQREKSFKWRTNADSNVIGSINSLKRDCDLLIITKSYKDCRVIRNLGYESVWFQSESSYPSDYIIKHLLKTYKRVVVFFDNDLTGKECSVKLKDKLSSITNASVDIIESEVFYLKDISEMVQFKGVHYASEFLSKALNTENNSSFLA